MNTQDKMGNNEGTSTAKPVEVMPATTDEFDANEWLLDTLGKYRNFDCETVTELPFEIDSSNATNLEHMFDNFYSLTTVPKMDSRF